MLGVRRAIHIRTGQRAAVDAIDAWLARHDVDVVRVDDVYGACAHLLRHYERIPDLALLGADWLSEEELSIVAYLRHTWPRVGVVVYGAARSTPMLDMMPMTHSCRVENDLARLVAESPDALVQRLRARAASLAPPSGPATRAAPDHTAELRAPAVAPAAARVAPREAVERHEIAPGARGAAGPAPVVPPRATLTAEELSALLDADDES